MTLLPTRPVPPHRKLAAAFGVALLALLAAGCDREPSATTTRQTMEETGAAFAKEPIPTREVGSAIDALEYESYALSLADLGAYEKGVAFENARLEEAVGQGGAEGMAAFVAALPEQTEPAAAAHAGVALDRYRDLKLAVHDVLVKLDRPRRQPADAPADDAILHESTAEMQAALDDPYAGLEPPVAKAFATRLTQIRALATRNAALLDQAGG